MVTSSSDIPRTMQALTIIEATTPSTRDIALTTVPVPNPLPTQCLIKVHSIALNPTDWKSTHIPETISHRTGSIIGCDVSGTILEAPTASSRDDLRPGDRVAGWIHGSSCLYPSFGAFAQYSVLDSHALWRVPDSITFDQAAAVNVAISTAGLALWSKDGWAGEYEPGEWCLVYGGATSVGQVLVQFAKREGLNVVAVASQRNWGMLKQRGADVCVDYKDAGKCVEEVRDVTEGKLRWAYDGISEGESFGIVHRCMSDILPAKIVHVLPLHWGLTEEVKKPNVKDGVIFSYFALGRDVEFLGQRIPPREDLMEALGRAMRTAEEMAENGELMMQEVEVLPDGLAGVREGFKRAMNEGLGPRKLVWRVEETPS